MALTEFLKGIADAIRAKKGTTETINAQDFATEIANLPSGGGSDELFKAVMERSATEFKSESITKVSQYTCYNYTTLKTVDFPNLITIEAYAFNNCSAITSFNAPKLKSMGSYGFYNVANLTSINFPEMTTVGGYGFRQCRKITKAMFPKLTSVGAYGFSRCNVLAVVDLGIISNIGGNVFAEDSNLKTIILRKTDSITTLGAVNAFTSTPFATNGSGGTVYVPQALIEQYQTATNWVTLYEAGTCTFLPLEGSQYE